MTACLRRWARRGKSNDLPARLAAIRRDRRAYLGSGALDLLGKAWI
jgi:hypothetical protein